MRNILLRNLFVVIPFLILHTAFLMTENLFSESTAELICILMFLLLPVILTFVNSSNHTGRYSRGKRVALRIAAVTASFVFCWGIAWLISCLCA